LGGLQRAWSSMQDGAASQTRHLTAIRRLSEDYVVRPEEREKLAEPLILVLAKHDEYFNNDKLLRWGEFATNTVSHYIDAGHQLLSHHETAEVVRSACTKVEMADVENYSVAEPTPSRMSPHAGYYVRAPAAHQDT